jgi:hypothetical protein
VEEMVESLNGRMMMRSDMHGGPPVCIMHLV